MNLQNNNRAIIIKYSGETCATTGKIAHISQSTMNNDFLREETSNKSVRIRYSYIIEKGRQVENVFPFEH